MKNNLSKKSDIIKQCRRYDISLWEHPQFLFAIMGIIIIISIVVIYLIGVRYLVAPQAIIILVFLITALLFGISYVITHSFEKLAEANRGKDHLIKIVSHQIRTPITNLKWMHDALIRNREDLTEDQLDNLVIMKENIDRMVKITTSLLVASNIERKELFIKKDMVSLEKFIRETIDQALLSFFPKFDKEKLSFHVEENIPPILTDPVQIQWVVRSLFDNAVRHNQDQSRAKIDIAIKKAEKNRILFEIRDNGPGIPKEDQKYLFDKFFRGKMALVRNTQGAGLSLFACKAIIEELGGRMGYESKEGEGSVFWFTLPVN